jgi:hypothetical protein
MDLHPGTRADAPAVDVSGLEVPGLEALSQVRVGHVALGVLVPFLTSVDPAQLDSDFDVLELVAAWHAVAAAVAGQQLAAIAELGSRLEVYGRDDDPDVIARRSARSEKGTTTRTGLGDEVAARLVDSQAGAERHSRAALELPHRFPFMWVELRSGRASEQKARILIDACSALDDGLARQVDARVSQLATRQPPARFRQTVRRAVLRVDPDTASERRERAEADRCVRIRHADDGMAELWALLPALDATKLGHALDSAARAARAAGDERTLDQLRADQLTAGVTGTVEVQVVVPASVLLGQSDAPAELVGHGPVDPQLARTLAADATWRRLLTDPDDRTLLSVGTTTYRPGAVLARQVRTRDRSCRFPACDRPARGCDLDHTTPFDGLTGLTAEHNLGPLCPHHHRYKHSCPTRSPAPPRLTQPAPGHFRWTLATGHHYAVHPPPLLDADDPLHRRASADVSSGPSPADRAVHHFLRGWLAGRNAA